MLDLPEGSARELARGEIKALLDSPELRRIFDEAPADRRRVRPARDGRMRGRPAEGADGLGEPVAPRRSRKRRVLIGLAPVYIAGLILFFEAVREPSLLLDAFGVPSAAQEPVSRAGAVVLAAAPAAGLDESIEAPQRSAAAEAGPDERAAPDPAPRAETATKLAIAETPTTESLSTAVDIASPVANPSVGDPGTAPADPPGEPAIEPPLLLASDTTPTPALAYPDPRAGPQPQADAEPIDPAAAQAAEEALGLSRGERREIQRRLRFAASDPQMIDGIFGPATRSAIAAWQEQVGLPATGFMDEAAIALLVEQTADQYQAWRVAERARAREREAEEAVVASSAPPTPMPQAGLDGCTRTVSGEIAFGRDVGCNFRAFGANFKRDFRALKGNIRQLFD